MFDFFFNFPDVNTYVVNTFFKLLVITLFERSILEDYGLVSCWDNEKTLLTLTIRKQRTQGQLYPSWKICCTDPT
jgi:hypothetical protein